MEVALAQLIGGSGGYAATVGGNVKVFGTSDIDVISLADIAGTITFDGSFNRGGDFILLPNSAKAYTIARSGSSVTITDADSNITIPVGTKGTTLKFSDGELVLKFNGQVQLGSQVVTATSTGITATLSAKTTLPTATSSTGTLILAPNDPVLIGGNVKIFGTNGADTVTVADVAGSISFDGSFNRGGDKIVLSKFAESYSIARPNASNVVIGDEDTKLTIPLGTRGLSVKFSNEERTLVYSDGDARLGNQKLGSTPVNLLTLESNINFVLKKNYFIGEVPFNGASFNAVIIDINKDGLKDILFTFKSSYPRIEGEVLSQNHEAPNEVRLFVNTGNSFEDQTAKYLIGTRGLGGLYTSHIVLDLNKDGYEDIVFATNQEDGPRKNTEDFYGSLSAFISNNGTYSITSFGDRLWYHDLAYGKIGGTDLFMFSSSPGPDETRSVIEYVDGAFRFSNIVAPYFTGNAYQFSRDAVTGKDYVIKNKSYPDLLSLEAFARNDDGTWDRVGEIINPLQFVKEVDFLAWTGAETTKAWVYLDGSDYILVGGGNTMQRIGKLKISPSSEEILLFKMDTPIIKNYDENLSVIDQNKTEGASIISAGAIIIGAVVRNGSLMRVELNFENQIKELNSFNTIDVYDFNKDGYDDILVRSFSGNGIPTIYINNRNGGFNKPLDINIDEIFTYHNSAVAGSIIDDFNNDGIPDIIIAPFNGNNVGIGNSMTEFFFYQGSAGFG